MIPTPEAAAWRKQMLGLLQAQEVDGLPVPLLLSWDSIEAKVEVQVREADYRAWMEAIAAPTLEAKPYNGTTHLYASGKLRKCLMVKVLVIAVAHEVGELPEVGVR